MDQPTFADLEYGQRKRKTRQEEFLERLERLVPRQRLEERIRPHYFRGQRGRRPYALAVMLRVHVVQLYYNLSDPAMEDLLYEAESVRRFAGLRLTEALPDETAILHFRYLLEAASTGPGTVCGNQGPSGGTGSAAQGGNHHGRHHHCGAAAHPMRLEPSYGNYPPVLSASRGRRHGDAGVAR